MMQLVITPVCVLCFHYQAYHDVGTTVAKIDDDENMEGLLWSDLVTALSVPTLMARFKLNTIDLLKVILSMIYVNFFSVPPSNRSNRQYIFFGCVGVSHTERSVSTILFDEDLLRT